MNCPVCDNPAAENITMHTFDGKTFRCPSCGDYDVTGSVYDTGLLYALNVPQRKDALARAKLHTVWGMRPRIATIHL